MTIPILTDCRLPHNGGFVGPPKMVSAAYEVYAHRCREDSRCDAFDLEKRSKTVVVPGPPFRPRALQEAMASVTDDVMMSRLMPERPTPGLTDAEHEWMSQSALLWNALCKIVDTGDTRDHDLNEAAGHLHALQHMVMSQVAARQYPHLYRPLGGKRHGDT